MPGDSNRESRPESFGSAVLPELPGDQQEEPCLVEFAIDGVDEASEADHCAVAGGVDDPGRDEEAVFCGESFEEIHVGDRILDQPTGHGFQFWERDLVEGGKSHRTSL